MQKMLLSVVIAAVAGSVLAAGDAQARSRRHRDAGPPPAAEGQAYGGPAWLTPADRAKSGWIDGASPYNPEGSSNPQIPNNS